MDGASSSTTSTLPVAGLPGPSPSPNCAYEQQLLHRRPGQYRNILDLNPKANFDSLPTEIMLQVFSYLNNQDLLDARITSQRWNNIISNWNGFLDKFSFLWTRELESRYFFIGSKTPWKAIVAEGNFCMNASDDSFLLNTPPALTTLILRNCDFTWLWLKEATTKLRHLQNLSIIKCSRIVQDEDEGWFQTPSQVAAFIEFRRRLKTLRLEVTKLSEVNFLMKQFTCDSGSALTTLQIKIELGFEVFEDHNRVLAGHPMVGDFVKNFPNLINSYSSTLKSLKVDTSIFLAVPFFMSLRELLQSNLDLNLFHYHWSDAYEHRYTRIQESAEKHFSDFIKAQVNLKSIGLPRTGRYTRVPINMTGYPDIDIGMCCASLPAQMLTSLPPLKTIKIGLNHTNELFSFERNGDREQGDPAFYTHLTGLNIQGLGMGSIHSNIELMLSAFPNLDSLIISAGTGFENERRSSLMEFLDEDIQSVIRHLPNLRILDIPTSDMVTDCGVAGVSMSDSAKLYQSRSLYMEQDLEFLGYTANGLPLCSLKHLTEVTFRSASSSISDVGIFYGFKFKNLKKLNIACGDELSDWGLMQVAKLNPNLESCSVVTESSNISSAGIIVFEKLLPRARHNISVVAPDPSPECSFSSSISSPSSLILNPLSDIESSETETE